MAKECMKPGGREGYESKGGGGGGGKKRIIRGRRIQVKGTL